MLGAGLLSCGSTSLTSFAPVGGEKVSDLVGGHRGQACQHIGKVFLGVNAVAAAALVDGVDDGTAPPRKGNRVRSESRNADWAIALSRRGGLTSKG